MDRNGDIYRETDADGGCKRRRLELARVKLNEQRSLADAAVTNENRLLIRINGNRKVKSYAAPYKEERPINAYRKLNLFSILEII